MTEKFISVPQATRDSGGGLPILEIYLELQLTPVIAQFADGSGIVQQKRFAIFTVGVCEGVQRQF